jgi:hypothetical protein
LIKIIAQDAHEAGRRRSPQRCPSGLLWLGSGQFIGQANSWISTIAVIRRLAPADHGLMAMPMRYPSRAGHDTVVSPRWRALRAQFSPSTANGLRQIRGLSPEPLSRDDVELDAVKVHCRAGLASIGSDGALPRRACVDWQ